MLKISCKQMDMPLMGLTIQPLLFQRSVSGHSQHLKCTHQLIKLNISSKSRNLGGNHQPMKQRVMGVPQTTLEKIRSA